MPRFKDIRAGTAIPTGPGQTGPRIKRWARGQVVAEAPQPDQLRDETANDVLTDTCRAVAGHQVREIMRPILQAMPETPTPYAQGIAAGHKRESTNPFPAGSKEAAEWEQGEQDGWRDEEAACQAWE